MPAAVNRMRELYAAAFEVRPSLVSYESLMRRQGFPSIAVRTAERLERLDAALADAADLLTEWGSK
jgi:hypothetical protein